MSTDFLDASRGPATAPIASTTELHDLVIDWFDDHARDLPWRHPDAGAWSVMVSEFMLQQTPVSRVLPVHAEWLARWPRPADLAADSPGEAVRGWGRLGYPRRALRLHAAATAIAQQHGG
ncbi:MAG: A/G-specific adenine glycosylase, partial [Streptomyces sp.]|nr:A/G-specific adenine glycosylase [Streptomyces sp.]